MMTQDIQSNNIEIIPLRSADMPQSDASESSFDDSPSQDSSLQAPFISHLSELRDRILNSLLTLSLTTSGAFLFSTPLITVLKKTAPTSTQFIQLTPGEVFLSTLHLSFIAGVALAMPVFLYHVLRFTLPALKPQEKNGLFWVVGGGSVLFGLGVMFAYYCVLPPSLNWLLGFGKDVAVLQMSIGRFVEFCTAFLLIIGLMFELPLVLILLSLTGVIHSRMLTQYWRGACVSLFMIAIIFTPSQDPLSMGLVGLALVGLYGLSIVPMKLLGR